jgi:lysophospholipase L1-like esterase
MIRLAGLAGLIVTACALVAPTAAAQTISGVVHDDQSCWPMPGVEVVLRGDSTERRAITGPDGAFSIANLAEPRYDLRASLVGFYSFERELVPSAPESTALVIVLPLDEPVEAQIVEGAARPVVRNTIRVQDQSCAPIAAASVALDGPSHWSGATDARGEAAIPDAPSGAYRVTAAAPGYTAATIAPVTLPFRFRDALTLSLRRGPPQPPDSFVKGTGITSGIGDRAIVDTRAAQRIRIVAMGDSTTAGTPAFRSPREAPPNGDGDVTSQYAYWLMKSHAGWDVINQGVNAQRSDVIAARFDEDVIAKRPAVVVIIAGVNDVYQGRPAQHVKDQLAAMYARARAAGIRVVAGTIIPYNTATPDQNARMHDINAWIRAQADAGVVTFVDTRAAVAARGNPDMLASSPDGLHPDADGYHRMADAIAPAVERALARR